MVNINRPTKMMVNRCIELLNAKIANAQSRHIAKRAWVECVAKRPLDMKSLQRERQKAETYKATKQLSMWELNKYPPNENTVGGSRMDDLHYKCLGVNERTYDCTWANFNEEPKTKTRSERSSVRKDVPVRRRKTGHLPPTAKPWDDQAKDFITQWHKNTGPMSINKYFNPPNLSSKVREDHQIGKPLRKKTLDG